MLSENEKKEINKNLENGIPLSEDLKDKMLQAIKSGTFYPFGQVTICCKYLNGSKTEFDKMSKSDCTDVFFGVVVSDDNCKDSGSGA